MPPMKKPFYLRESGIPKRLGPETTGTKSSHLSNTKLKQISDNSKGFSLHLCFLQDMVQFGMERIWNINHWIRTLGAKQPNPGMIWLIHEIRKELGQFHPKLISSSNII